MLRAFSITAFLVIATLTGGKYAEAGSGVTPSTPPNVAQASLPVKSATKPPPPPAKPPPPTQQQLNDRLITAVAALKTDSPLTGVDAALASGAKPDAVDKNGSPALLLAVAAGNVAAVSDLVSHKANVEARDRSGETAVQLAATAGKPECVRILAAHGADLFAAGPSGSTPIAAAAARGDVTMVTALLDAGASARAAPRNGPARAASPLESALRSGKLEAAKLLVKRGADSSEVTSGGETMIGVACDARDTGEVRWLVETGADVKAPGPAVIPPLLSAVKAGQVDAVKLLAAHGAPIADSALAEAVAVHSAPVAQALLDLGAKVDGTDQSGRTPLIDAASNGDIDIMRLLIEHGADVLHRDRAGSDALHAACALGGADAASLLLSHGAPVDLLDDRGWSPIAIAAAHHHSSGSMAVLDALASHGAQVYQAVGNMRTILTMVAATDDVDCALWLIEHHADPNAPSADGVTPLIAAIRALEPSMASALLHHGVDPNAANGGLTPLLAAIERDSLPMVTLLVEGGANIHAVTPPSIDTPIMRAVQVSSPDIVEYLLAHGSGADEMDAHRSTPLMYAARAGRVDNVQVLLKHGAPVSVEDDAGNTALQMAVRYRRQDVADLLRQAGALQ